VGLTYSLNRDRLKVEASGNGGVRYYPALQTGEPYVPSENGHIGATLRLTGSTTLSTNAIVTRRPQNMDGMLSPARELGVGPETSDFDLPTTFDYRRRYAGSAVVSQQLSRRTTFQAHYGQRWAEAAQEPSFTSKQAGGTLTVGVTNGLAVRAGYGYAQGLYQQDGRRIGHHNIDAGINYSRALSFSRRTTLSFSTGSSAVKHEGYTRYRATGAADLTHEIGRTWMASLAYFRGARLVETWNEPLYSDVMTANLGGMLNRRLQFASSAGGSLRQLGAPDSRRGFTSYWGTANMSIALSQHLNFGVDYLYTRNRFDVNVPLPIAWPQRSERQRISAHIAIWMPLLTQTRRADATR
jgi:hypothetical protein